MYQYITGYRLAKWEDDQKGLEKESVGKPRPNDPIVILIQHLIKKFKLGHKK
jgi:hypothetical protein